MKVFVKFISNNKKYVLNIGDESYSQISIVYDQRLKDIENILQVNGIINGQDDRNYSQVTLFNKIREQCIKRNNYKVLVNKKKKTVNANEECLQKWKVNVKWI